MVGTKEVLCGVGGQPEAVARSAEYPTVQPHLPEAHPAGFADPCPYGRHFRRMA